MNTRQLLSLLLLTSTVFGQGSTLISKGIGSRWPQLSNKVITTHILSEAGNISTVDQCLRLCLKIQTCMSVFYRKVFRRCQFHDVLFMSKSVWKKVNAEDEMGTEYYSLTTGSCPPGYIHARHLLLCYQLHLKLKSHSESTADCATRGEHLIVIDSQEKQNYTKKQVTASPDADRSYYIDGSDVTGTGQWVFHDGRPLTFFAFAPGFPTNHSRQSLVFHKKKDFLWTNRVGKMQNYFLCQKDL